MSTWDDFGYDDDDELLDKGVDSEFVAADENDIASVKAAAGAALDPPEVDWDGPVIDVPQGRRARWNNGNAFRRRLFIVRNKRRC